MNQNTMLTTTSLLTILLMTFHLASDIQFHMSPAGLINLFAVFVFVVFLYGTLLLAERRAGYIIILLGSLYALVMPLLHMKGPRGMLGGEIGNSGQAFFFVWTLLALATTATFSLILAARALLTSSRRRS